MADFAVQLFAARCQQAEVGYLLNQGVLENIFQFRKEAFFIDELQALKVQEIGFKFIVRTGNGFENAVSKISADDRRDLHSHWTRPRHLQ